MIKIKSVDERSWLKRFDVNFLVTAAALDLFTIVPVACNLEKIELGANAAGSTATTVVVTKAIDATVVGSGTFTSGTVGTVLVQKNALRDVGITQGSLLMVDVSGTTAMAHTVNLVFSVNKNLEN